MTSKLTVKSIVATLIILATCCLLFAQPHSDNYILKKWAISSGGGSSSSSNYQAVSVIGQSSPPGVSSSTSYVLYSGFLGPIYGLPGSASVWIWTVGSDVYLDWEDVPEAHTFYIYRSTDPAFVPGPSNLVGSTSESQYVDTGAVGDPDAKYFYKITCSN